MRIVRRTEREIWETYKAISPEARGPAPEGKTVEFGKEDILALVIVAILLFGYARGQLTIQELLAYLGVSATGGVWGMLGGSASSK